MGNAAPLVQAGAAVLIRDQELSGQRLAAELQRLMADQHLRMEMAERSRKLGRPQAATRVAELVEALAGGARLGQALAG
jgi:UDP-N-acetylglucosamine--N-acetylmuramyl-(pentapeptide) pyrophosphoryl-undecaprenol N-acetylglucosamine transferase